MKNKFFYNHVLIIFLCFNLSACTYYRKVGSVRQEEITLSSESGVEIDKRFDISLKSEGYKITARAENVLVVGDISEKELREIQDKCRPSIGLCVGMTIFHIAIFPLTTLIILSEWAEGEPFDAGYLEGCTVHISDSKTIKTYKVNEHVVEHKTPYKGDETIKVYINGHYKGKINIGNEGVAYFNAGFYPIDLKKAFDDVEVKFKFMNAEAVARIDKEVYASALKKYSKPCDLKLSFLFDDNEGINPNGAIDAAEEAYAKIKLTNTGQGTAFGVAIIAESDNDFIDIPRRTIIGDIPEASTKEVKIAIKGDVKTTTSKVKLKILAEEERGFGSNTVIKQVKTVAMVPTGLEIVSYRILDGNIGLAKGNGNGIPENGETIEIEVFIKNNGKGEAKSVSLIATNIDTMTKLIRKKAIIGNISPGKTTTGKLVFELDRGYKKDTLNPNIMVSEKFEIDKTYKKLEIPIKLQKPVLTISACTSGSGGVNIKNGDTAYIDLSVLNRAGIDAKNVNLYFSVGERGPSIGGKTSIFLGNIAANSETNPLRVKINIPRTYQEKGVTLRMQLNQNEFDSVEDFTVINIEPSKPQLTIRWHVQDGMIKNMVEMGKAAHIKAIIGNMGGIPAERVKLKISSSEPSIYPYFPDGGQEIELYNIPPKISVERDFWIQAKKFGNIKPGNYNVVISVSQKDFASEKKNLPLTTVDSVSFEELIAKNTKTSSSPYISSYSPDFYPHRLVHK